MSSDQPDTVHALRRHIVRTEPGGMGFGIEPTSIADDAERSPQ